MKKSQNLIVFPKNRSEWQSQFKEIVPKTWAEWFMPIGFVIYMFTEIAGNLVFDSERMALFFPAMISVTGPHPARPFELLARLTQYFGLIIFHIGLIVSGIHHVRREGVNAKRLALPIVWVCLCLLTSGRAWHIHRTLTEYEPDRRIIKELAEVEKKLQGGELSLDERSCLGKHYAATRYYKGGTCMDYQTPDGNSTKYVPTKTMQEIRQEKILREREMNWRRKSAYRSAFIWLALATGGILLGVATPVSLTKRAN